VFSSRFIRLARLDRLRRREGVSDQAVALVFVARAADEVLSSAWSVLTPTFRVAFRLTLVQVGVLSQLLNWVALVVEPVAAVHIDTRSRRALMALGAGALAASMVAMGGATGFVWLAVGFALYGVGSGPLVMTADVLVVESFPWSPERAFGRATFVDTLGAVAGPALVALAGALGVPWRILLVALGGLVVGYAFCLGGRDFPPPATMASSSGAGEAESPLVGSGGQGREAVRVLARAATVLRDRAARRWLLVLLCFELFEAAFVLKFIWLHDAVGLSQPLVAVYAVGEQVVGLVALALLDRWLIRMDAEPVFGVAVAALVVLPTAWVAAPGVAGRILVGMPLAFAHALVWPLVKARSLTALPELGGATQAISALFPLIPLVLLEARLATALGVGPAMALSATAGALLMLGVLGKRPGQRHQI
jgi:MFS family permease